MCEWKKNLENTEFIFLDPKTRVISLFTTLTVTMTVAL